MMILVESLSVYIQVIAALMPYLEKLTIYAKSDYYEMGIWEEYGAEGFSIEKQFASLLKNDLRTLTSLRVLEVLTQTEKSFLLQSPPWCGLPKKLRREYMRRW